MFRRMLSFSQFHYNFIMSILIRPAQQYLSTSTPFERVTITPISHNIYKTTIPKHQTSFLATRLIQVANTHAQITLCDHTHTGINQAIMDIDGVREELTTETYIWIVWNFINHCSIRKHKTTKNCL